MFYAQKSDKYKFIMCTNSRAGSTMMKRWLIDLHGLDMPDDHDFISPHNIGVQFEVDRESFDKTPYFKFLVVRNPWERLVSFYKAWVVVNQSHYETGLTRSSSFLDVISLLEERPPRDPRSVVQAHGLEGIRFDKVVYLETIEKDIKEVLERCGVPDNFPFSKKVFVAPTTESKAEKPYDTPGDVFVETGEWPKWQDFYNPEIVKRVSKIYADDLKAFGYRWEGGSASVAFDRVGAPKSEQRTKHATQPTSKSVKAHRRRG
jgi:hypothetical protein